jgi:biopolymer transport protein TolR
MAHIESSSGSRKTNIEVNLVPVIDLMSVLITFLLITAVWTQVSMIQIGSSIYGKKTDMLPSQMPPKAEVVLKVEIRKNGYTLTAGRQVSSIPLSSGQFDDASLVSKLKDFKDMYPDKIDGALTMADDLPYENLIKGMDALLQAGFSPSILTGGPN